MALAIVQPDGVPLPVGQEVERFLEDRLTNMLKAPTENTNVLTIWNRMEQVLCVGWSDGDTPRVICYESGDWERELKKDSCQRARRAE